MNTSAYLNPQSSQGKNPLRQSQRILNKLNRAKEELDTQDPVEFLPVELLAEIYKYCSNSDLCRLRLVSKDWKFSVGDSWRRRVTICVHQGEQDGCKGTAFLKFKEAIEEPSFCYAKFPFRRMKLETFSFLYRHYKLRSEICRFTDFVAPTIFHLELADCSFKNTAHFLRFFLGKFENLKTLVLTGPKHLNTDSPNTESNLKQHGCKSEPGQDFPPFVNLTSLKIDYSVFKYRNHKPFQFPWSSFFCCTPNLERLNIDVWKNSLGGPNLSIEIIDVLRPLEELSLQNKLTKLKHIHVCLKVSYVTQQSYQQLCSTVKTQVESHQRSALKLDSLSFEVVVAQFEESVLMNAMVANTNSDFTGTIVSKFGEGLRHLDLRHWKESFRHFPPHPVTNLRMEKLEHLSLSIGLGEYIESAENMPNLRSLEILYLPRHTQQSSDLIVSKKHERYPTDEELQETNIVRENYDDADDPDYEIGDTVPLYSYKGKRDLQLKYNAKRENVRNDSAIHFLQCVDPDMFGFPVFKLITHFRCEAIPLVNIHALPKWMPNLSSLELPLDAEGFTVVCDKLRQLQRLTITRVCESLEGPPFIDDCAITGRRHNSRNILMCSCNGFATRTKREKSINWSYFKGLGQPAMNPNITYLQDLRSFKMEAYDTETVFRDPTRRVDGAFRVMNTCLTDASVFDGFYKLPRLHFLQINARLSEQTTAELFRRIPKCILRWTSKQKNVNGRNIYNVRENFERDNIA